MKYNNSSVFGATHVAESEIVDIADNFNDNATGWDEFKPKVIKIAIWGWQTPQLPRTERP